MRGGHIPGAKSIPWSTAANSDGTFKSVDELNAIYGGKGVTADKPVITYCRIGERSAHTWFVLTQLLDYPNVRNYDGSFRDRGELEAIYEQEQGLTRDADVIAYCRIGERSSHTWFVLSYLLGFPNVRNYDGSWTEWGNLVDVPIER